MQIIHLISTICRGGAETQLLTLAREQVSQGHHVSVYYLKGVPELEVEFTSNGVLVHHDLVGHSFLSQILKLRKSLNRQAGVLHAHLPKSELIASIVKQKHIFVVSKHNAEQFFPNVRPVVSRALARFVHKRCDGIIYISNAVQRFMEEISETYETTPTWVIHYGFNSEYVKPSTSSRSQLNGKELTVGTVSRLAKQKDLNTLLKAISKNLKTYPDARLTLVGRGPERVRLEHAAKKLGIDGSITWVDFTHNVYSEISTMDIFCLTSLYEGFGLVLLEAMQCQVPIVASRNSAIIEVLGEDYPYFFETSDADDLALQITALTDSIKRQEAISYLQNRLKLFSPVEMSNKIENVYNFLRH